MVGGHDGLTPLVYHEPHCNKYYWYIIYSISFMNFYSDLMVQTAPDCISFRWWAKRIFNAIPKYIKCISSSSVVSFKSKLDYYLKNIIDLPGRLGFSNSLDSGDILQWWTPREDLASN